MTIKSKKYICFKFGFKMDIAERKKNLIQDIFDLDENVLEKVELFINSFHSDWYNELTKEELADLNLGIHQAKNNEFVSHKSIMDNFSKWHTK